MLGAMGTRRWEVGVIGCGMAFVPLTMFAPIRYFVGVRGTIRPEAIRELLFFALSMSSNALFALNERPERSSQLYVLGSGVRSVSRRRDIARCGGGSQCLSFLTDRRYGRNH
jgi:hypothetical protein